MNNPRRHGKPITTPRHLTLRHGRRILAARTFDGVQTNLLEKGWERLYSSDVPGLQAGSYVASAKQVIEVSMDDKLDPITTKQPFGVLRPRFTIPQDTVYSVYPPPGHVVSHDVLPHIVFNDPTMPWEQRVQTKEDGEPKEELSTVPWLALFAFTPDELKVDGGTLKSAFEKTSIATSVEQNESMAIQIPIGDILKLNTNQVVGLYKEVKDSVSDTTNVVLVPNKLVNAFFSKYDEAGKPVATVSPYISRHKYLAHLRRVNVEGMTTADDHESETDREFGILIANRTGPLSNPKPAPVIVHLVSLEGVDGINPFPVMTPYVAMVSLYSWRYTVQSPGSFDLKETFEQLANTQMMLRPPVPVLDPTMNPTQQRVLGRLMEGYSLSRYKTQTGEETVALFRGPLVPTNPEKPEWNLLSTSGSDLHILDQQLGILDITFSSAWQLGRTLALADRAFATALTRVRREISRNGDHAAQVKLLRAAGRPFKSRLELATTVGSTLEQLASLSKAEDVATRWASPAQDAVNLSLTGIDMTYFMEESLRESARLVAGADDDSDEMRPYNEFNTPRSVDWAVLHKFVMDLYHLNNVPSHYLITDPSHLPPESLRFFVIDQAWIDACVDGALSLGNHASRDGDPVRAEIKNQLNDYLEQIDPDLSYVPPVPRMGFVLRSEVVSKFPDLQIGVVNSKSVNPLEPLKLVRTMQLDEGMMMGFLSEAATGSADEILTFTVPAHQQSFTAATKLTPGDIEMVYKRIYTTDSGDGSIERSKSVAEPTWVRGAGNAEQRPVPFVWGSEDEKEKTTEDIRLLLVEHIASDVYKTLSTAKTADGKVMFKEAAASSAMMGIQLNSPAWQLKVNLPQLQKVPKWSSLSNARSVAAGVPPVEKRLPKKAVPRPDFPWVLL